LDKAELVVKLLFSKGLKIATAESCTGGMLAEKITSVGGASSCFGIGVITYSNESKVKILGVSENTLSQFGAVSEQTAREMAAGIKKLSKADIAVSITGIAGPDGGTIDKPVGLVYVGINNEVFRLRLDGDRENIRNKTVDFVLDKVYNAFEGD